VPVHTPAGQANLVQRFAYHVAATRAQVKPLKQVRGDPLARQDALLCARPASPQSAGKQRLEAYAPFATLPPYCQTEGGVLRKKKDSTKSTRKMTKSTCAIQAAVPAIPAKPKNPAMIAMTKKISAYDNITNFFFLPGFSFVPSRLCKTVRFSI
jgi:hypothetical protein